MLSILEYQFNSEQSLVHIDVSYIRLFRSSNNYRMNEKQSLVRALNVNKKGLEHQYKTWKSNNLSQRTITGTMLYNVHWIPKGACQAPLTIFPTSKHFSPDCSKENLEK